MNQIDKCKTCPDVKALAERYEFEHQRFWDLRKTMKEDISVRDKWWLEWAESKCPYPEHYPFDGGTKRQCPFCWQSLKQSLEVKE